MSEEELSRNKEIIIERLIELAQEENEENDRSDSGD